MRLPVASLSPALATFRTLWADKLGPSGWPTWTIFEEVVHGDPCYGEGIGNVSRAGAEVAVVANAARSNLSNHVLAQQRLTDAVLLAGVDEDVGALLDGRRRGAGILDAVLTRGRLR